MEYKEVIEKNDGIREIDNVELKRQARKVKNYNIEELSKILDKDEKIADIRIRMGLSQHQFAKLFNIPPGTLKNWEQGLCKPPKCLPPLLMLAESLISVDDIESIKFVREVMEDNKTGITWFDKFELYLKYVKEFGKEPPVNDDYEGVDLGFWCWYQKKCYKENTLTSFKYRLLNAVGFKFD